MQHKFILGAATASILAAGALAFPQNDKPQGDKPMPKAEKLDKNMHAGPSGAMCHKASKVIGAKLSNAQNQKIGEIEDLVLDPISGRIDFAVVSLESKNAKDQWYAVPFQSLAMAAHDGLKDGERADAKKMTDPEFTLQQIDVAKIEGAPGFAKDKWPDLSAPAWRADLDRYYGRTGESSGDVIASRRAVRASKVLDQNVYTTADEKVGDVEELGIDPRNARISYLVVSTGGFLGIGDKLHALPWEAAKPMPGTGKDGDKLVVDLTKERLTKAPEFKKDDWNRMSEAAYLNELYTYYGVRPYWTGATDAPRDTKAPMPPREKSGDKRDPNDPR